MATGCDSVSSYSASIDSRLAAVVAGPGGPDLIVSQHRSAPIDNFDV